MSIPHAALKNTLKPDPSSGAKLQLQVLLVDRDVLLLTLLGNILKGFGVEYVHYASTGQLAQQVLETHSIDVVISEWPMGISDGAETIAQLLRQANGAKYQKIPLIVLTSNDRASIVKNSRDCGINEFMLKPLKVAKLCERIRSVIEDPREFIISPSYIGPDRRRKDIPISKEVDRRLPPEKEKELSKREENKTILQLEDKEIIKEDKDLSLVRKIGQAVDLDDIFSLSLIEEAQNMVNDAENEYMAQASEDIIWLTNAVKQLNLDPENIQILDPMKKRVTTIRDKSGVFGFHMSSTTCHSLLEYLENVTKLNQDKINVLKEHLDILIVVFHKRIQGTGGDKGHQLTHYIEKLKKRFPAED